jgi:fibronectin-binding autotransporter adhesin
MKTLSCSYATLIALIAGIFATSLQSQTLWLGTNSLTVTTNWSDPLNWSGGTGDNGMPSSADAVKFFDSGAAATVSNINNVVDAAFAANSSSGTIASLQYGNTNGFHTTYIQPGVTLNVGTLSVGTTVNSGALTVNSTITGGSGATLNLSGPNFGVSQGSNGKAILDLSGLDALVANITTLGVGAINYPATDSADVGSLILAKTNYLTITGSTTSGSGSGTQSGFLVGDPRTTGPTSGSSILLGKTNGIFANLIVVGARKGGSQTHSMIFNPAFTNANPTAYFRAADGISPVPFWMIGDEFFASGGSTACNGSVNLTGGAVDALIQTNIIGRGQGGAGNRGTGTLTISAGTFYVGTMQIGFQSGSTSGNGPGTGTANINGTATLVVSNVLELTHITTAGTAAGTTVGTLNVNGGTVLANHVINGGGVTSTFAMTNGSLVLSNTMGLPSAAISICAISNSTLRLTIFAAPTTNIVTTNLFTGGATNVINIDSLPAIGAYPATFHILKYSTQAGVFNIGLGTLPTSSPSFAGYVTNNSALNSVDLVVTTGPAPPGTPLVWTAAISADWDTSTTNWSNFGAPTKYTDGSPVQFDDTAANPSVNLTGFFGPASTTVSNDSLAYTFSGVGAIGSSGVLIKKGSGLLTIGNSSANTYSGGTLISAGTLQLGNNDTAGNFGLGNVTNNASLIFNRSDNASVANTISGTGSLTKNGNGTLTITSASSYSGATVVNSGSLLLNGILSGGGVLSNAVGTTLGGNGTNAGPVSVSGQLSPGDSAGTFGAGGLSMDSGATLNFDVNASNAIGSGVNDLLQVNGNLSLNNNSITINLLGSPANGSTYRIANYTGTLAGTFDPTVAIAGGSHATATLDYSTANQVNVTFNGFANLRWYSFGSGEWDNGISPNWSNIVSGATSDFFYGGDSVVFDDEPGVITTIDIASGVAALPANVVNDSTNNSFIISGAGKITGPTGILKKGDSTLTLSTSNDFTGNVVISGGILKLGAVATANFALGATNVPAIVTNGGTLDLGGFGGGAGTRNLGAKTLVVSGSGFNGQGAIINSTGSRSDNALANVALAGDATLAANGTAGAFSWNIRGGQLSTSGHAYNLTILGPARLSLFSVAVDPALANIDVQSGTFELGDYTSGLGNPANTVTVESGATLSFFANNPPGTTTSLWSKVFILNGDGATTTLNNRGGGAHALNGPVTLNGPCIWNGAFTNFGNIAGTGSLTRSGGGTLTLLGTNSYSGDTTINAGTLALVGSSGLSNSPNISIVATNAALDVMARSDSSLNLVSGQTLSGDGIVRGSLLATFGSTVSPGVFAPGTLTVSNTITLLGTTLMEIDKAAATNDLLRSSNSIVFGGTLNVSSLSTALADGDSFKLFDAPSYSGAFTNIVPANPDTGLYWDTTALTTSGILKVTSTLPQPHPQITNAVISNSNITISGSNGTSSGNYIVLASTNLVTPLSNWMPVATNSFDSNGNFTFTMAVDANLPQRFYLLQLP